MAPRKSMFDMELNQTVNYPSWNVRVTRAPLSVWDRQDDYKFIAKRNYPEGTMASTMFVAMDQMDDFSTDVLLYMFDENLDKFYSQHTFATRMRQIKRSIRGKVRRHLRRKSARLAVA